MIFDQLQLTAERAAVSKKISATVLDGDDEKPFAVHQTDPDLLHLMPGKKDAIIHFYNERYITGLIL